MKKILLILAVLFCFVGTSQVFEGMQLVPKTTAAIQALPNNQGQVEYSSDTGTIWQNNGTAWVDTGTGGGDPSTWSQFPATQNVNMDTFRTLYESALGKQAQIGYTGETFFFNFLTGSSLNYDLPNDRFSLGGTVRIDGLAGNGSGVVGVDNNGDLSWSAGGGGSIGGSISNNQIAVGAATANNIENSGIAWDGSQFNLPGVFTGGTQSGQAGSTLDLSRDGTFPSVKVELPSGSRFTIQEETQAVWGTDAIAFGIRPNVTTKNAVLEGYAAGDFFIGTGGNGNNDIVFFTNRSERARLNDAQLDLQGLNLNNVGTVTGIALADLDNVGTAGAGLGEVLIGNGATYNSNPLTAALVSYNNSTSGLTATIVQDGIDENAANNTLLDGRTTIVEDNVSTLANRVQILEDANANPSSSTRVNEIKTAPYTFVIADAEDRKQIILNYNDLAATLNGGIFPTGTVLKVLAHPQAAGPVHVLEGTNVSFLGYGDGVTISNGAPILIERLGTDTAPETWMVIGPSADIADYSAYGPEILTNPDFSGGSTGWGTQNGSAIVVGEATVEGNGSPTATAANHVLYQDVTALTASDEYRLEVHWRRSSGSGDAYLSEKFANLYTNASLSGTEIIETHDFVANGQDRIVVAAANGTQLKVTYVSLKKKL